MLKIKAQTVRWLLGAIFFIYMMVLFDLVFLNEGFGRLNSEILRYQVVNLVPFKTIKNYINVWDKISHQIILTNLLGNIMAFVPFGALIPFLWFKRHKLIRTLLCSAVLSIFIELTQGFLGVGVVDIDDLILNTLGGLVGFMIYWIGHWIVPKKGWVLK